MDLIITKTLAEIYIQQGHLKEAYEILRKLSEEDPSNREIRKKLKELNEKLFPSQSTNDSPVIAPEEKVRLLKKWLANIRKIKVNNGKFFL